jgi:ethanolamine-phosphate cytidylyltransferase
MDPILFVVIQYILFYSALMKAQRTVRDLEEKLLSLEQNDLRMSNKGKDIVIFMDGAFDMMHYGHMNAFRQGRSLGTKLIVGVNDDESITACKGISTVP